MVSRVQLPPEIQLAQRLAGNEQVTRDRAVRKLRKYIVARTQRPAGGFTHDELLKVWKGLFYCMWMQDKPLVQEELGRTISQLIHAFQTTEAQHLFLQTFWQTMNREWAGIDRLRLDKFYMLMRMVLNESLKAVQMRGWEARQIEQLLKLLTAEILHPNSQAPNGVKSHFIEIFLEELTKVGAAELTADQNLRIIDPFCRIAAQTKDSLVLHNIVRSIFDAIVEQAPFAIEDLMNELDAQGEEVEMSVGDDDDEVLDSDDESLEGGEVEQDLPSKKPPKGSICRTEPKLGERQEEDDGDGTSLVLQFDYAAVANRLFKMASQQNTPSQNRKRLYKVIRKLQDLAEGTFPEDDVPEKVYGNLLQGRQERKKKRRSSKSRLQSKKGKGEEEDTKPDPSSRKKSKRKWTRKRGLGADSAEPADSSGQLGKGHGQKGARWGRKKHPQLSRATAKPKKQKGTLESRR
ncbi:ribosomal RNA processing protein 1 homolog A isoform X2 [Tupaia chinensis]|uniref:ribosomal RNA processing protein 1 homolog A isoform X2 n=1 Tax=Tupaia chinensis TaxID=246437 RepID=UPI0003C8FCB3|nr:ribosomal RNA processing protein 1 homolog A isoform X2 [Tupaia chinensis]